MLIIFPSLTASGRRFLLVFPLICLVAAVTPLAWRFAAPLWQSGARPESYLPALEPFRDRAPFDPAPIDVLRQVDPQYVLIGDSMADRVHWPTLTRLSGGRMTSVHENSTGSAYWYLTFKNYIVASGVKPRFVFVFFRDWLLTDPTFRLTGNYRRKIDMVAVDKEPELDRVLAARSGSMWYALHQSLDRTYGIERAREWIEPRLTKWPARVVIGSRRQQGLLDEINEAFSLEHLRAIPQADVDAAANRDLDFQANLETSILPEFIALARAHDIRLCFIRVIRRPINGRLAPESPALRQYVRELRAYLASEGVAFLDDRDEPALATLPYGDGDHVGAAAREPYTESLWRRVQALR